MAQPNTDDLLRKGMTAVRRGHLEPARRLLGQVVEAEPHNEMAWLWLAQAADPQDPAQKRTALQRVIELNPQNKWAADELQKLTASAAPAGSAATTFESAHQDAMPEDQFGKITLEQISCPSCTAPLNLQAGEMIKTAVCEHCQTVVDLSEGQPAAKGKVKRKARPGQPIKPGDQATIGKKQYQVVGWLRFKGWDDEDTWYWTEWLLASSDGDFRWLSHSAEDGFTLFRPMRIEKEFDLKTGFPVPGASVKERSPAKIVSLGGELTWKATVGERFNYIDARKGDKIYSVEYTRDEVELTEGVRLSDVQVWKAFGRDDMIKKVKVRASSRQYYGRLRNITAFFLMLGLCSILTSFILGSQIYQQTITVSTENREALIGPINIDSPRRPHQINTDLNGLPVNNWAVVDATLIDEFENEYYLFSEEFWDEDGYDSDGYWRENDYSGTYTFRPEEAGEHYLSIEFDEATVSSVTLTVTVWEGVMLARYFIIFTVICGGLAFVLNARAKA